MAGILAVLPCAAGGAVATAPAAAVPDTIYLGRIVTMDPAVPAAAGVAVRGEEIIAVGSRRAVLGLKGHGTRIVELAGRAMLPGFIDAHGHLTATTGSFQYANLASPPAGAIRSIAELQEALRRYIVERHVPAGGWVIGMGYDDSLLAERRHPTRAELDAVSTAHPILVIHVSGHLSVANSRVLAAAGIDAATLDPPAGVIRRAAGSREPDGVLEEAAHMAVFRLMPRATLEQMLPLLSSALDYYAGFGITTVQDGAAVPENLALLEEAARRHRLNLDVVAYRYWVPVGAAFPDDRPYGRYADRLKIGGIKLILDGSPQGKTAYLSEPYLVPPPGQPAGYRGYPSLPPAAVEKAVREALSRNVPVLAHANGDAAAQMLIDAVDAARRATGNAADKVVMIHAQTVRDDQLDRMKVLGIVPSFFVGHTFYWGDWHRDETLGPARAERISPTRSALERGLAFTLHNDAPVVPPDILRTVWSAATRRTRSNAVLGASQRLTVAEALAGVTINAAMQYSEDDRKGSITAGKLADLVILSADPLASEPEHLLDIRVLETISHGKTVYPRQ